MTIFVSLDSSSPAQCAALRNEIDTANGGYDLDPLQILMHEEEEFDTEFALDVLRLRHFRAGRSV